MCDGETADVCKITRRRAMKNHVCEECTNTIVPGEHYDSVFLAWEGTAETYKVCVPCRELYRWMDRVHHLHENAAATARWEAWSKKTDELKVEADRLTALVPPCHEAIGELLATVADWGRGGFAIPAELLAHIKDAVRQERNEERSVSGLATVEETIQTGVG